MYALSMRKSEKARAKELAHLWALTEYMPLYVKAGLTKAWCKNDY